MDLFILFSSHIQMVEYAYFIRGSFIVNSHSLLGDVDVRSGIYNGRTEWLPLGIESDVLQK